MDFVRPRKTIKGYAIQSISFKGVEIFAATDDDEYPSLIEYQEFKHKMSELLSVPPAYLKIVSNIGITESIRVSLPYDLMLERV